MEEWMKALSGVALVAATVLSGLDAAVGFVVAWQSEGAAVYLDAGLSASPRP